jgi:AraC-like DNA-binding protein
MSTLTLGESVALQRFVGCVQVLAGRVVGVPVGDLPALFREIADEIPEHSTRFSLGLIALTSGRTRGCREEFLSYITDVECRLAAASNTVDASDARVVMALEFIHKHYGRRLLAVADVAEAVRVSKWHLDRLLRQHTGRCFVAHLHEARLDAARSLLIDAMPTVKEVASAVGYSSVTQLDRHFRKRCGCTPTQWRQKHLGTPTTSSPTPRHQLSNR